MPPPPCWYGPSSRQGPYQHSSPGTGPRGVHKLTGGPKLNFALLLLDWTEYISSKQGYKGAFISWVHFVSQSLSVMFDTYILLALYVGLNMYQVNRQTSVLILWWALSYVNILYTGWLFSCYMLDNFICYFRKCLVYFVTFILFLKETPVSKQCRPLIRCHIMWLWSGSALFSLNPFTGFHVRMG